MSHMDNLSIKAIAEVDRKMRQKTNAFDVKEVSQPFEIVSSEEKDKFSASNTQSQEEEKEPQTLSKERSDLNQLPQDADEIYGSLTQRSSSTISDVVEVVRNIKQMAPAQNSDKNMDEKVFLRNLREKLLVLFEGFSASSNETTQVKVELTQNFLEYTLATIEERLENLEQ